MKAIIENIKIGLQMIVIGAILLYIGTTVFMPDMTIKFFGFQPFIVVTESMEPNIAVNDVVVATKFNVDQAEKGQIITFEADIDYNGTQEVVTHYIYSIEGEGDETVIRTHRHFDNPDEVVPDTWIISASDVIGSYSFQVKYLGLAIGFIKSVYGIAVISANIAIFSLIKYINYREDKKQIEQLNKKESNINLATEKKVATS
jgi:signal peptidase